jgi:hypothetical protein
MSPANCRAKIRQDFSVYAQWCELQTIVRFTSPGSDIKKQRPTKTVLKLQVSYQGKAAEKKFIPN